jgi:hypothetical protein
MQGAPATNECGSPRTDFESSAVASSVLLEPTSPLRNLSAGLNTRQRLYLDGIRYSIENADFAWELLTDALFALPDAEPDTEEMHRLFPQAVHASWSLVDSFNRLRVLLDSFPGLKKNAPAHQIMFRALQPFEDLRNPIQHLDSELRAVHSGEGLAVWGSLAWLRFDPNDLQRCQSCVLVAGSVQNVEHGFVNPAGKPIHSVVDHVEMTAFGVTVLLSDTERKLRSFVRTFEEMLRQQFEGLPTGGGDMLIVLEFGSPGSEEPEE